MAAPMKGIWARRAQQAYSGASVWGTGYNPVHMYYGSPNTRLMPTRPMHLMPHELPDQWQPHEGPPDTTNESNVHPAGTYTNVYYDDRPAWDVPTTNNPSRFSTGNQPPWSAPGRVNEAFRAAFGGARVFFRGRTPRANYPIPTETVSEGWLNKPKGIPADATPSSPDQYERQTSMQQRYAVRSNRLAVERNTDPPRAEIGSRVTGQKLKFYSGEERHYDMYPYQQTADRERPFFFRTAGTGYPWWLEPNQMPERTALERTPPPDPYIGQEDATMGYGYTAEDQFYA